MPSDSNILLRELANAYTKAYPSAASSELEKLPAQAISDYLETLSKQDAVSILQTLNPDLAAETIALLPDEPTRDFLSAIKPNKIASLISRLEKHEQNKNLSILEDELAKEIRAIMSYPVNTAGYIMDPRYLSFSTGATVNEIIKKLNVFRKRKIVDALILDEDGVPVGVVPLQSLLLADPQTKISDLVTEPPVTIRDMSLHEEVVELLSLKKLTSLPVVDSENHVLGVIRYADLIHAVEEEATVDIQTMVGAGKDERALSSPFLSVRKRLPWLNINLLTAFVAAGVVGLFENVIAQVTALAVLLPVVAGQSGNTGAQALAVTMRGLALREVRASQWKQLLLKESLAGAMNGIAIAIVTALGVYIWSQSLGLALVICVSMVIAMTIAGASGAAIPIVLTKLGQDPAQASSIILTTVTDVFGFLSFLGLAALFIQFL